MAEEGGVMKKIRFIGLGALAALVAILGTSVLAIVPMHPFWP